MSRNHASRATGPGERGPSLVGKLAVVVAVIVATSTFAAAVAVAAPGGNAVTADGSPTAAVEAATGATGPAATTESTDSATRSVDVVFIVDSSQSMNTDRYQLASEMRSFQRTLLEKGVDARFGLVTYTEDATVRQTFTDDFSKVEDAMQFQTGGNVERTSNAVLTASEMNFRPDAERVYVVLTNEDDDSSSALRQQALNRLAQGTFVTISPVKASKSGCHRHLEPCDNSSANELRQYAQQVDGEWLNIDDSSSENMQAAASVVAEAAGSSVSSDDGPGAIEVDAGPSVSVVNRSLNVTTVEVGESVAVTATLRNAGLVEGSYEVFLTESARDLERTTVEVAHRSERTVTLTHTFEEPGEYELVLNNERVGTVDVTDVNDTSMRVTTTPERNRLLADISDAREGSTIDIDVPSSSLLSTPGADLRSISVTSTDDVVTPEHDLAFGLAVERTTVPPSDVPPLSTNASAPTYMSVTSTLADSEISSVAFQYANASADVRMYRYDRETAEWVALPQDAVTDESLVATTSELSTFAIAIDGPVVAVESVQMDETTATVGETTSATVTVRNRANEERAYDATISLDGEIVASERVSVPAGETVDVTVEYVPTTAGEYALAVGGTDRGTLDVEPAPTTTRPATTTPSQTESSEQPATTGTSESKSEPTTGAEDGATPGFSAFLAVLAVLALSLYATRRR